MTIINFNSIENFETARLSARRQTENDFHLMLATYQDKLTMETMGGIVTLDAASKRIQWNLECWNKDGFGAWLWFHKNTGEFIGRGGLRRLDIEEKSVIEVGYVLLSQFWNQGFATEIAIASIEVAFEHLGIKELVCYTAITNKASQHVMEKAGFKFSHNFIHDNAPHVLYQIAVNDFRK